MIITAKFASVCPACGKCIAVGTKVEWSKGSKAQCAHHPVAAAKPTRYAFRSRTRGFGGPLAGGRWAEGSSGYYSSGQYDEES